MNAFIDAHRDAFGVEPICAVLPIVPSMYDEHKARVNDPTRVPIRAQRDAQLRLQIDRGWRQNRCVCGAKNVWKQLRREQIPVARCTVGRLMKASGWRGVVRGRHVRTTVPDGSRCRVTAHIWNSIKESLLNWRSCRENLQFLPCKRFRKSS